MTEGLDPLLSVAEISAAFAGFAGIVSAIAHRGTDVWQPGNLTRLHLMIYSSLAATLMALVPFLFALNTDVINWTLCVGVFAAFLIVFSTIQIRTFIRLVREGALNGYVATFSAGITLFGTGTQILGVFGVFEAGLGVYFVGIFCLLVVCSIAFVRLVTATIMAGMP